MISTILTVCVGNICRSPMAEILLQRSVPFAHVSSAGIGALIGHPADEIAQHLMAEKDLDISMHRARQIDGGMCQRADIILVMEEGHKKYIQQKYSFTQGKVFRLAEHARLDIPDPYRQPRSAFETSLELIEVGVQAWSERIARL